MDLPHETDETDKGARYAIVISQATMWQARRAEDAGKAVTSDD